SKCDIPVQFKPSNTLRHTLVHPKDKIPKHKLSNFVYAVQCSEDCSDLNIARLNNTSMGAWYASLYFCCAIEEQDNELITLEIIHRFVELLDKYFGSVSLKTHLSVLKICIVFLSLT
uniref:AP complex mu/sigma subunit domain-containing protein n=1 Tax=Mola mola TaxID=94237 RepID=A0A3Q3XK57_MOLML